MRSLSCPHGCELLTASGRTYSALRRTCRDHLRYKHGVSCRRLPEEIRIMLGSSYRESPEYELDELPVWPDVITVQLEAEP